MCANKLLMLLLLLHSNTWNHLTVCQKKWAQVCLKCYQQNVFTNHMYLIYMYKEDLALNNLWWLICHKTKPSISKQCFEDVLVWCYTHWGSVFGNVLSTYLHVFLLLLWYCSICFLIYMYVCVYFIYTFYIRHWIWLVLRNIIIICLDCFGFFV